MKKWNLIIDVAACNNCNNCFLAVKDEHVGNDFPGYAAPQPKHGHHWLEMKRAEHGRAPIVDIVNVPTLCNHCDDAPCVRVGHGAVKKRDDGIVIIDPVKAKGRRDLVDACPYGAVWWNEELQLPQHWIFDAHLLDRGWKEPRCTQACPTGAMRAIKVDDAEMQALARGEGLEVMAPELGAKPRVYYRNLHRYNKWFIAGSVAVIKDGVEDCLENASVRCYRDGALVGETHSDNYGEFRLGKLPAIQASYRVQISHPGYNDVKVELLLNGSHTMENFVLLPIERQQLETETL